MIICKLLILIFLIKVMVYELEPYAFHQYTSVLQIDTTEPSGTCIVPTFSGL